MGRLTVTTARASAGGDHGASPLAYAAMALVMAVLAALVLQVGLKAAAEHCVTSTETWRTEDGEYRSGTRTTCS